jgi:hexosaminidase
MIGFTVYLGLIVSSVNGITSSPFWPQPQQYSLGTTTLLIDPDFYFNLNQQSEFLIQAVQRYEKLISSPIPSSSSSKERATIASCNVNVVSIHEDEYPTLQMNVDESYSLIIKEDTTCEINAQTVWGCLHAFETFTQLLSRDVNGPVYTTYGPVSVTDDSRFTHRGVLIDTSRHYIPIDALKSFIDTLPMNKFNVLHWHMVDAQSFPVDTPSAPEIVKGAYSPSHIYSMADIAMLTQYAADRGVRIFPEIDIPGHAASWKNGYPEIMADCFEKYYYNINNFALDPTKDETYNIVDLVLGDIISSTTSKQLHLGGDEVVYGW